MTSLLLLFWQINWNPNNLESSLLCPHISTPGYFIVHNTGRPEYVQHGELILVCVLGKFFITTKCSKVDHCRKFRAWIFRVVSVVSSLLENRKESSWKSCDFECGCFYLWRHSDPGKNQSVFIIRFEGTWSLAIQEHGCFCVTIAYATGLTNLNCLKNSCLRIDPCFFLNLSYFIAHLLPSFCDL